MLSATRTSSKPDASGAAATDQSGFSLTSSSVPGLTSWMNCLTKQVMTATEIWYSARAKPDGLPLHRFNDVADTSISMERQIRQWSTMSISHQYAQSGRRWRRPEKFRRDVTFAAGNRHKNPLGAHYKAQQQETFDDGATLKPQSGLLANTGRSL
jgi:hypothetical protein